eukprot:PhF_6_TR38719/c0_g1_i3/m.57951
MRVRGIIAAVTITSALGWCYATLRRALHRTPDNEPDIWVNNPEVATPTSSDIAVILLWGGAKHRAVKHLVAHYKRRCAAVIVLNPSTGPYLSGIELVEHLSMLLIVAEHAKTGGRIIIHLFSNHGIVSLTAMVLAARRFAKQVPDHHKAFVESFPQNISAVIVDSAPYFPPFRLRWVPESFYSLLEAVGYHHVYGPVVRNTAHRLAIQPILTIPTLCLWLLWRNIKCTLSKSFVTPNDMLDCFQRDPTAFMSLNAYQLYVTSTGDKHVPTEAVTSFVKRLRILSADGGDQISSSPQSGGAMLRKVDIKVFDGDVPHVHLLKALPEMYLRVITDFLDRIPKRKILT